jgi:glucose-6-phosphate-specific signal transduction histidine kinase
VVGGINTMLGYLLTLILRFAFFSEEPKWILITSILEFDVSNTFMFLILFPLSYTLQAVLAFRQPWKWRRLLVYPVSSIPNYLLQQGFILLFETGLNIPPILAYGLAAILPIPLMYLVVKYLVSNNKKTSV